MSPMLQREIDKKTKLLRADYGGMMTMEQLSKELNTDKKVVRIWIMENSLGGVKVGKRIKYETDQVARVIVNSRGMN